jgi:non-ribosomal peptide synthetase-like protein
VILKWIIIGKYVPQNKPLWSGFVWRSELITGIYENFLVLFFLNVLTGTPFIKIPLKMLGSKLGKRSCIYTTQITEFDLIHVGDYAALNDNCTMQTHLFEDRVMKMSYVTLEENASVGGMAVVLYDSKMCRNAILEPLSVLMKMSKKEIKDKRAEKKADHTVKILFISLVIFGLLLMIWFAVANS